MVATPGGHRGRVAHRLQRRPHRGRRRRGVAAQQPQGALQRPLQRGGQGAAPLGAAAQPGRRGRLGRGCQEVWRRRWRVAVAVGDELGEGGGGRRLVELG